MALHIALCKYSSVTGQDKVATKAFQKFAISGEGVIVSGAGRIGRSSNRSWF